MQDFQPILIAIGFLAIAGVLAHGFLLSRKNKRILRDQEAEIEAMELEESTIDSDELTSEIVENTDLDAIDFSSASITENQESQELKFNFDEIDNDPVPVVTLNEDNVDQGVLESEAVNDNENDIETDIAIDTETSSSTTEPVVENIKEETIETQPVDIFVFNVVRREESKLGGHELLQFFLTSGFRFGAMNIFHRHENSDGTGEVLFSIANMMAPGTFDLDLMEQFNSPGISFFLTAPNPKISIKKSFDLMLRAVEQLADEFDCDVLNEHREPLTEKQFIEYRNKLQQYP